MKVAFVTSYPRDAAMPRGGVEAVSVVLAPALAEFDDLDVHVITAEADCESRQVEIHGRLSVHRIPRGGGSTLRNALGEGRGILNEYLRSLQPDVVHAHDTYGLMMHGSPLPRIFTIHGFIHADTRLSGRKFPRLRAAIWRHYELRGWRDQPHIISISPYVREAISGLVRGTIHDIDNPIDAGFFDLPLPRARKPVIFCAGAICRRKNALQLVEAMPAILRASPGAELRLAGHDAEADYSATLRRRIDALGLRVQVSLLGAIPQSQIREELRSASVFALVSLEEGAPMGVEEAMAAGVPVVASNRCGMPYMIRDGVSGALVDPTDPNDIAARVAAILSNAATIEAMGKCGRRIAQDRFHPAVVAQRTRDVYRRALRRPVQA